MKSSHRFPLRRQIVWGMRFFTFLTSLAVGAALFILSNQYVRANSLQAAEFNLRLVATSIETSLESADALLNWASIDSTVRRYISQENINGTQTIAAYEAMQEKYYSSTLYSHILRFFVTNENDRHLQFGPLNSSAALNRTSVKQFLTKGYGMQFTTDPRLEGVRGWIALSQPVRCGKGTLHRGSTYLALDTAIITDPAAGYSLTDGSALYWEMGSRLWQIENGSLTEIENPLREVDYTLRTGSNNGVTEQTAWQGKVQLDGQKYYVVKVTLNGRSAALVQLLPANTFLLHYGVYLWLVALGTAIIWGLSFLMQHWLERVITRPVEALQKRIETVGSGNFAPDRTVEWNNELGDIGRGINQLAENVDSLMTRRVEDERRKQELEYRMLQNEVSPHFIYNTLNSIRWMATIQHAPGIAVVDAPEVLAAADGPVHRVGLDAEDFFNVLHQLKRVAGLAVHLVDEGEDRDVAQRADLEQLDGLGLNALGGVNDHDGGVRRHQGAVGVLTEVLVAGRVQNVDALALIVELQNRRGNGNTALLFNVHPVGHRMLGALLALDRTCGLDGPTVEQEFFGECGFTGVGVRDDRKCAPGFDFFAQ